MIYRELQLPEQSTQREPKKRLLCRLGWFSWHSSDWELKFVPDEEFVNEDQWLDHSVEVFLEHVSRFVTKSVWDAPRVGTEELFQPFHKCCGKPYNGPWSVMYTSVLADQVLLKMEKIQSHLSVVLDRKLRELNRCYSTEVSDQVIILRTFIGKKIATSLSEVVDSIVNNT